MQPHTPEIKLSFITLLLLISFASVNAVLFTPALPYIALFFNVTHAAAQETIVWFLIGYAFGQLLYGPIANRFGRKQALYMGISLQIISSLICILSGLIHVYSLLVLGRFLLALGSGVGLTMTFTLINECYESKIAAQKASYLMLAFAITPGVGVAVGGVLNMLYGWMSCFYAGAVYGLILLLCVTRLPETKKNLDLNALNISYLLKTYKNQFKNSQLILGGLLMAGATCVVYVFAATAPFIAIMIFGINSAEYGIANILPPIGMVLGSLVSAQLSKKYTIERVVQSGIIIAIVGVIIMLAGMLLKWPVLYCLFSPMIIIYFGLCFVFANASVLAMRNVSDKAHGSAVMSFMNMGAVTLLVLSLGLFPMKPLLLPIMYMTLCIGMLGMLKLAV